MFIFYVMKNGHAGIVESLNPKLNWLMEIIELFATDASKDI